MWTPFSEQPLQSKPKSLALPAGGGSRIHFSDTLLPAAVEELAERVAGGAKVAVVTDSKVWESVPAEFREWLSSFPRIEVTPGEGSKSWTVLGEVMDFLAAERLDRQSVVIALGGGVVGDLAGFAAAIYQRGVACWQIPTTLLAMVDSSVGGKTGINLPAGKNLVGSFHQPERVWIATQFLQTLPKREFAAGMAEVLKYGLLGDVSLWNALAEKPLAQTGDDRLPPVIAHCCRIKASIVEEDEKETATSGGRALLNLGHTFGHALEKVTRYREYLHGEAVGVGMMAAAIYSARQMGWPEATVSVIESVLQAHQLPTRLRTALPVADLVDAMYGDKKNRGGRIRLVLMKQPGEAITWEETNIDWVREVWLQLGAQPPA